MCCLFFGIIQVHKYPLRSHSRTSVEPNRKSLPQRGHRELIALGASSSQTTSRDESEPSRLTRSGAVLRRSTRNSKGN